MDQERGETSEQRIAATARTLLALAKRIGKEPPLNPKS